MDMTAQQPADLSRAPLSQNGAARGATDIPEAATDLRIRAANELSLAGTNGTLVPAGLTLDATLSEKEDNDDDDDEAATDLSMNAMTSSRRDNDGDLSTPELQPVGFDNKVSHA